MIPPPPLRPSPDAPSTSFPALFDSLVDGVLAVVDGGRIVGANLAAATMFGHRRDELVGRSYEALLAEGWDVVTVADHAPSGTDHERDGDTWRHETLGRRADGSEFPMEVTWAPTDPASGSRLVTVRDVSDRRSWEDALRSSETLHRSLVGALDAGVMMFERDGSILAANASALRLLAVTEDQLAARRVPPYGWRFVDEAGEPLDEAHLPPMTVLATGEPVSNVVLGVHTDDGDLRWLTMNAQPLRRPDGQRPYAAVASFTDVTERRHAEHLKSEIISVVSHELRTPLASLRGSLGLVSGGAAGEVPERAARLLEIAVANTDRLIRLLDDLLAIEKLDSGTIELRLESRSLAGLAEHVAAVMTPMATVAGVEVHSEVPPLVVDVDGDRITQTLTNLVNNAIKFTGNGTAIRITAAPSDDGREVVVSVHDRGPGIPEAQRERVFDRFVQIGDAADGRKGGSGLGLAICRGIVEQHGGRIWVDSTVGRGSTFSFSLPVSQTDELAA